MATIADTYSNDYKGENIHQNALSGMIKEQLTLSGLSKDTVKIGDVFSNPGLDLGFGTDDPTIRSIYPQARTLTWNLQRIEAVMRADPFFTRALEYRSSKPIMGGIDISSDEIDSERLTELQELKEEKLDLAIKEGFFDADAFGWSALLILVDGHMNKQKLKQPLRKKDINKDKFLGIKPLVRWYQINPAQKMITELGKRHEIYDPRLLGTPLYYKVSFDGDKGKMYEVHRSRLIIIPRNKLSYIEKKVEHYGGTSILEQGFESLSRYHALVSQIHRILNKAVIPVLKLSDLESAGLQTEKGRDKVQQKIDQIRKNIANNNLMVIGEDDSLEFEQANLQNLDKQLQEARLQVCTAFNTPPKDLFFEDDGETTDFNGFIKERQQFKLKPIYNQLLPILYQSEYGEEMPKFKINFKPLENLTTEQIATARKDNIEALNVLFEGGVINTKTFQDTLSDIDNNPHDILRNLDPEYASFIESMGTEEGYHTSQIRLAQALNQDGDGYQEKKIKGKEQGGDPSSTKKPTPRTPLNKKE